MAEDLFVVYLLLPLLVYAVYIFAIQYFQCGCRLYRIGYSVLSPYFALVTITLT